MTSHLDLFKRDDHGIHGSEKRPIDSHHKTDLIRGIMQVLKAYLQSETFVSIDYSQYLDLVKNTWLSEFHSYNESKHPKPLNMNDICAHLYGILYYCHYHRSYSRKKNIEQPIPYDWKLLVDGCCALATLAGSRHIGLFGVPLSYPSLEDLYEIIRIHHIGYLLTFYYWKKEGGQYHIKSCIQEQMIQWRQDMHIKDLQQMTLTTSIAEPYTHKSSNSYAIAASKMRINQMIPDFITPSDSWVELRLQHTITSSDDLLMVGVESWLWNRKPESYVDRFIMMYNHIVAQVECEHCLFRYYPRRDKPIFNNYEVSKGKVMEWIENTMSFTCSEEFNQTFIDIAFEYLLPLGSRTYDTRSRSMNRRHEKPDLLFQQMLGTKAVIKIAHLMGDKLSISTQPNHFLFPYLLLTILHYDLFRKQQKFYNVFVLPPTSLLTDGQRVLEQSIDHMKPRRPIMCYITGTWCIHDQRSWIVCDDIIEVILVWFSILHGTYNAQFVNRFSAMEWIKKFELI